MSNKVKLTELGDAEHKVDSSATIDTAVGGSAAKSAAKVKLTEMHVPQSADATSEDRERLNTQMSLSNMTRGYLGDQLEDTRQSIEDYNPQMYAQQRRMAAYDKLESGDETRSRITDIYRDVEAHDPADSYIGKKHKVADAMVSSLPTAGENTTDVMLGDARFTREEAYDAMVGMVEQTMHQRLITDDPRYRSDYFIKNYGTSLRGYLQQLDNTLAELGEALDSEAGREIGALIDAQTHPDAFVGRYLGALVGKESHGAGMIREARDHIRSIASNNFASGFAEAFDWTTMLTAGVNELMSGVVLNNVLNKAFNGERLTAREEVAYKAYQVSEELNQLHEMVGGRSTWNNIGMNVGESTEIAPQFAAAMVTGGAAAGALGVGLRNLPIRAAGKMVVNSFRKGVLNGIKTGVLTTGRLAGTAALNVGKAEAIGMASSIIMPSTWGNFVDKRNGQFKMEDGKLTFTPSTTWKDAVDAWIEGGAEVGSEMIGGRISSLLGGSARAFGRLIGVDKIASKMGIGKASRTLFGYKKPAFVRNLERNVGFAGPLAEPLSEVWGDASANLLKGAVTGRDNWENITSKEYWLTTLGACAIYGGALTTATSALPIAKRYAQIGIYGHQRKKHLEQIEDAELYNAVVEALAIEDMDEAAQKLASLDWKRYHRIDMGNAMDAIRADYAQRVAIGTEEETARLNYFAGVASRASALAYRGKDGTTLEDYILRIKDKDGIVYPVISGDATSQFYICYDANFNKVSIPTANVVETSQIAVGEEISNEYDTLFSMEGEMRRQSDLIEAYESLRDGKGVGDRIKGLAQQFGVPVRESGDNVTLADGMTRGVIWDYVEDRGEYIVATEDGGMVTVPFYDVLSDNESVAEAQTLNYAQRKQTQVQEALDAQDAVTPDGNVVTTPTATRYAVGDIVYTPSGTQVRVREINSDGTYEVDHNLEESVAPADMRLETFNEADLRGDAAEAVEEVRMQEVEASSTEEVITTEGVAPTEEEIKHDEITPVPMNDDGTINYDAIEDPQQYATLYAQEAGGVEAAIEEVRDMRAAIEEEVSKSMEKWKKAKTANEKMQNRRERNALAARMAFYDNVLNILEAQIAPTEAVEATTSKDARMSVSEAGTVSETPQTEAETPVQREAGLVENEYTPRLRASIAETIDALAKTFGLVVEFVDDVYDADTGARANADIRGNVVRIAWRNRTRSISFLIGHEFTHRMQDLSTAAYGSFKEAVIKFLGEDVWNARVDAMVSLYERAGIIRSREELEDEVTADVVGMLVRDKHAFETFLENKEKTFIDKVIEVFERIIAAISSRVADNRAVKDVIASLNDLIAVAAEVQKGSVEAEEKTRFSLPVIQGLSEALNEYKGNGDITAFVEKVREVNDNIALNSPIIGGKLAYYEEDGNAEEFEGSIEEIVAEYGTEYAPYTAGNVRYSIDIAQIEAERDAIIESAKANGTYLKAPNGKKTNLTPEQWVDVRTARFKKWFGDWEKVARIEKLRSSKDAEISGNEFAITEDYKQNKKNALKYSQSFTGQYTNADTGVVIGIYRGRQNGGINEVLQHNYKDVAHIQSIAAIPQIIENSIYIESQPNNDVEKNPDVTEYQCYVCGLKIAGEEYTVLAKVAVDKNGNRYYDHNLTAIAKGKLIDIANNEQSAVTSGFGTTPDTESTTNSQRKYKELISILQTNSSKIVDENGEPKVMYHGTRDKFNTFIRRSDIGYHFGTKGTARVRAGRGKDAVMMPVFLNSRNPLTFDKDLGSWEADYVVRELLIMGLMTDAEATSILLLPNGQRRNLSNANKDLRAWIADKGYDSFVYPNWYESDGKLSYMVFNPNQIKSATDNVGTYNVNNPDIRYSLITPEMDAFYLEAVDRGDMATAQKMVMEAAKLAMPNTKVVDENGTPKVVYHGDRKKARYIFSTDTFFTPKEEYAKRYTNGTGEAYATFLDIKRPFDIRDKKAYDIFTEFRGGRKPVVTTTGAMDWGEYSYEDLQEYVEEVAPNEYDGFILDEGADPDGNGGVVHRGLSFVPFAPNQIKSADPVTYDDNGNVIPLSQRFNPKKEDIRYSLPSLVGVHNISLDKLRKVIKMGGLANPSVAVIDVDKQTHDDYGEYSLILPKNMVDARQGKNAGTWAGDAWTPTYPSVIKRMRDSKAMRLFYKDIETLPEAMRNRVRLDFDSFMDGRSANALAYWYLFEQGDAPELAYIPSRYPDDIANVVEEATKGSFSMYGLAPEDLAKCLDAYIAVKFDGDRAAFEAEMEARIARLTEAIATKKSDRVKKWAKESIDSIKEYGFDYDSVAEFIRDVGRDLREKGKVNIDATITVAREQIESSNREADYDAWRNNLDGRYGIEEYIFDGYTNSGDRKYLLHTIDNVSKWMKKQGRQGAVATFPSLGTFVAVTIPKMTTLEGIRKRKALLGKSKEEYDAFRERWEDVYFELGKKLQPDAKSFEEYGYWRLIEAAGHKDPTAFIKKQYGIELSAEDTAQLTNMLNAIRTEYPARYFETKFERPLQLSDFTAAVVPNDIPLDIESRLKDANVEVIQYEKGDSNSRAEAMQKASAIEGVRFSIIGEDVAVMEHAGYIQRLCDKARESYSITSSIVVAATKEDYAKTIEEAGYSSRNSKMTLAVYLKNTDTIAINAENITEIPIFVESISHENAHSITENLLMDEVKHVVQSFVKEEIDALQKVALKGYEECDPSEILDELISTFVQYFSTKQSGEVRLLDGYLKGYFYIDDLTDYMARVAIKTYGDRFAPIIKALMPILKKNLEINKERYERHETGDGRTIIRFDRANDAQRVNERGTGGTNRSIGVDATDSLYDSKVKAKAVDARQSLYDAPFFNDEDGEVIYFEDDEMELPAIEVRPRTTEGMIKIYMDKRHLAAKEKIRKETRDIIAVTRKLYKERDAERRKTIHTLRTNAAKIDFILGDIDRESISLFDQALIAIAEGMVHIRWDSDGAHKGIAAEIGLKDGEKKYYSSITKNATQSFEGFVHDWWESMNGYERGIDVQELRNALIDALRESPTATRAIEILRDKYDTALREMEDAIAQAEAQQEKLLADEKTRYEEEVTEFENGEDKASIIRYYEQGQLLNEDMAIAHGALRAMERELNSIRNQLDNKFIKRQISLAEMRKGIEAAKAAVMKAIEDTAVLKFNRRDVATLIDKLKDARSLNDVDAIRKRVEGTLQGYMLRQANNDMHRLLQMRLPNGELAETWIGRQIANGMITAADGKRIMADLWRGHNNKGVSVAKFVHGDTADAMVMLRKMVEENSKREVLERKEVTGEDGKTRTVVAKFGDDKELTFDVEGIRAANESRIANLEQKMREDMELEESKRKMTANEKVEYETRLLYAKYIDVIEAKQHVNNIRKDIDEIRNNDNIEEVRKREIINSLYKALPRAKAAYLKTMQDFATEVSSYMAEGRDKLKAFREAKEKHRNDILALGRNAVGDVKVTDNPPTVWERIKASARNTISDPDYTYMTTLRVIDHKAPNGEGKFYEHFAYEAQHASDNFFNAQYVHYSRLKDAIARFFPEFKGMNPFKAFAEIMNRTDEIAIGTIEYAKAVVNGKIKEQTTLPLNLSNAMYIVAMWDQPRYQIGMAKHGITEDKIREIKNAIPEEYLGFMEWVRDTFLPDTRKEYDEVHRRMFGISMDEEVNYFPARIMGYIQQVDISESEKSPNAKPSVTTGAIVSRKEHGLMPHVGMGYFQMLQAHIQNMDKWAAYAELNEELNTLASDNIFKSRLETMMPGDGRGRSGKGSLYDIFVSRCAIMAQCFNYSPTSIDAIALWFQKNWATSNITHRYFTALKQLSGLAVYAVTPKDLTRQLGRFAKNPAKYMREVSEMSPSFRQRWESRIAGSEILNKELNANGFADLNRSKRSAVTRGASSFWKVVHTVAIEWGMTPNAAVDAVVSAIGFMTLYEGSLNDMRKAGKEVTAADKKKAILEAEMRFNETQQSNEGAYLSRLQRQRSFLLAGVTTYLNATFGLHRLRKEGLREIFKKRTPEEIAEIEAEYGEGAIKRGKRKAWKKLMMGILGDAAFIGMTHGLPALVSLLGSGEDDDDTLWWEDILRFLGEVTLQTTFGGYIGGGLITGLYNGYDYDLTPSWIDFIRDLSKIWDMDSDDTLNDIFSWDRFSVYSTARFLGRYGIGIDIKTFTNIVKGLEGTVEGMIYGDGTAEAVLMFLNAPKSNIDAIAGRIRKGETALEYMTRILRLESIIIYSDYKDYFSENVRYIGDKSNNDFMIAAYKARNLLKEYNESYKRSVIRREGGVSMLRDVINTDHDYANIVKKMGWTPEARPNNKALEGGSYVAPVQSIEYGEYERLSNIQTYIAEMSDLIENFAGTDEGYYALTMQIHEAKKNLIKYYDEFNE